ncbi:MAG: hypothetical protein JSV65_05070 [Armatimonadota bacterium]|nr:MAG: hypothetical protein JSV65_05070 [Armatimonadota bacterium]
MTDLGDLEKRIACLELYVGVDPTRQTSVRRQDALLERVEQLERELRDTKAEVTRWLRDR